MERASESPLQRTMPAAAPATGERRFAPRDLIEILVPLASSSWDQRGDSRWGPNLDCMVGVVGPLSRGCRQPQPSSVQYVGERCRAEE